MVLSQERHEIHQILAKCSRHGEARKDQELPVSKLTLGFEECPDSAKQKSGHSHTKRIRPT